MPRILSLLVLLSFLLLGCGSSSKTPIRIATNHWIGYEPLYFAEHFGLLDEINVSLTEMSSASDVLRAFENGLLDCAGLTLDEAYLLLQQDIPVKVLLIMDISSGADVILAQKGCGSFQDLRGKKIGVESSAVGAYLLSRALDKEQISAEDIQVVTKVVVGHEKAFLSGEIDAVVISKSQNARWKFQKH